jgi:hypothetical protein
MNFSPNSPGRMETPFYLVLANMDHSMAYCPYPNIEQDFYTGYNSATGEQPLDNVSSSQSAKKEHLAWHV